MTTRPGRLRVGLVCEAAGGGVGKHVLDVAERLPSLGFDVFVACSLVRAEPDFLARLERHSGFGYRVANVEMRHAVGPHDLAGVIALRRAIRSFGGADVLHGHSAKGGALARLARWGCADRVFYTPHAFYAQAPTLSAVARRVYGLAEQTLAFATDYVIATSREELELARSLGIPDRKLTIVENGIEVRSAESLERARAIARASLGVGDDRRVVGFVGRLVPQKAPRLAVEVFRRLKSEYPRLEFVLVGDGSESPHVAAALESAGLAQSVRWLRRSVGRDVLPAIDVLLVTSEYEGFSYVMLESLDSGCAIVSRRVGGARDCIVDGQNGAIVDSRSAEALAAAVGDYVRSDDRLRVARTISRARARRFEMDRMVDRLVTLYRGDTRDAA
jgi:glycosyltransferase involved in cell wall biosynthesis